MYFIIKLLSDVYKYACVKEKKHPDLFSSTVFTVPLKDRILKLTQKDQNVYKKIFIISSLNFVLKKMRSEHSICLRESQNKEKELFVKIASFGTFCLNALS